MVGLNPATGHMQYEDVTDWGDVVELVDRGDVDQLRALFDEGMTFEEFHRDYSNQIEDSNYLQVAARANNLALLKLLIDWGADPDHWEDGSGDTAMSIATSHKDQKLLKYLLDVTRSEDARELGLRFLKSEQET